MNGEQTSFMMKTGFRIASLLAVALLSVFNLSAKDLGDYQLGDRAEEDIVATSKLNFVDVDATKAEREQEAQRIPVVLRYYTNAGAGVEAQFRQAFASTREDFLRSVEKLFGHRTLSAEDLNSFKFQSLVLLFEKQNQSFPMSASRAMRWASGADDNAYRDSLVAPLRQAMSSVIPPETMPPDFSLGETVRLIPLGNASQRISEVDATQTGRNFAQTNLTSLATARENLIDIFPEEDREVGNFLATLLEPNCAVDEAITQQLRAKRTERVWSVSNFEPGQIIARRGQIIDGKIKMAIDHLKEKKMVGQLQDLQVKQQAAVSQLQQIVAEDKTKGARTQARAFWLAGILAVVVLILAVATWQLAQRRHAVLLVPAQIGGAAAWQQRALTAEQRTHTLQSAARAGLAAHLSQWVSGVLTQRLISQRHTLLETHDTAAAEIAALEARLEQVQAPLQARLAAYERRIAELERELAARDAENRELLRAKIDTMRKQLEEERGKNRMKFN
jgi:membrane-associated HD superfamily phosphohydrolase